MSHFEPPSLSSDLQIQSLLTSITVDDDCDLSPLKLAYESYSVLAPELALPPFHDEVTSPGVQRRTTDPLPLQEDLFYDDEKIFLPPAPEPLNDWDDESQSDPSFFEPSIITYQKNCNSGEKLLLSEVTTPEPASPID